MPSSLLCFDFFGLKSPQLQSRAGIEETQLGERKKTRRRLELMQLLKGIFVRGRCPSSWKTHKL